MAEAPLSARGSPHHRNGGLMRPSSAQPGKRPGSALSSSLTTPRKPAEVSPLSPAVPVVGGLDGTPNADDVQQFLEVLDKHRQDCEREGRYEEAEVAKARCQQLREHAESKRREELRAHQLAERLHVEEAHMREIQLFNDSWDRKVVEFETHAHHIQDALAEKHKKEHAIFMQKATRSTEPRCPPRSKEYLNLRKIQESLAKQKLYTEAAEAKQQADQLEARETETWRIKREAKIRGLEDHFLQKQDLEMQGLLKRIQSGREEQKTQRKAELDRLLQRFNNVKQQLESQQKIITQRADKYLTTPVRSPQALNTSASLSRPASSASRVTALAG